MTRLLIWVEGDPHGWACSICRWVFPVPTLLGGEEAKEAYHRLAAVKFREHKCEAPTNLSGTNKQATQNVGTTFVESARFLVKRGFTPKVAVDLVLHDLEIKHRNDPRLMEKARAEAEDFLLKVRKGLI